MLNVIDDEFETEDAETFFTNHPDLKPIKDTIDEFCRNLTNCCQLESAYVATEVKLIGHESPFVVTSKLELQTDKKLN